MTTIKTSKIEVRTNPGAVPRVWINDVEMPKGFYESNFYWINEWICTNPISLDEYSKAHQDIKDMLHQQGQKGNYDIDEYMRGLYNGIELALCCIEKRDPALKSYPHVREV